MFGVGSGLQRAAKAVEFLVKMLSIQQMSVTNKRKIELLLRNLQVKLNKLLLDLWESRARTSLHFQINSPDGCDYYHLFIAAFQ